MSDPRSPDDIRNENRESGGGWEAGYVDPTVGRVLVPFVLKSDIIQPLERLENNVDRMREQLDDHLTEVKTAVHGRMQPIAMYVDGLMIRDEAEKVRKAKLKKVSIWTASIGGPVLLGVLAQVLGVRI